MKCLKPFDRIFASPSYVGLTVFVVVTRMFILDCQVDVSFRVCHINCLCIQRELKMLYKKIITALQCQN